MLLLLFKSLLRFGPEANQKPKPAHSTPLFDTRYINMYLLNQYIIQKFINLQDQTVQGFSTKVKFL